MKVFSIAQCLFVLVFQLEWGAHWNNIARLLEVSTRHANYWEPWEDEVDSWQVFEGNQIPNNCAEDNTPLLVAGKCWGKCHAPGAGKYI